jgi:hypothetical protein
MKLINSIDQMLHHTDDASKEVNISTGELKELLRNFLQINEYKRIQYKC